MKLFVFILSFFLTASAKAQSFVKYQDTINRFTIFIPQGWRYGTSKDYPSIKLFAYRIPSNSTDTSKDNFNINIIKNRPGLNLNRVYEDFLKSLSTVDDFKIIESGDTTINNRQFKWLIETHRNTIDKVQMHNFDFVTFANNQTYILTLVTFSNRFDERKVFFYTIANSFQILE